jgi:quercetin dioxygenase-like cupin family protein
MKIYRFDRDAGRTIDQYNSSGFVLSNVVQLFDETVVKCAYLEPNGVIGIHQAADTQLFLVVQGEGWVSGASHEKLPIKTGQAVLWEKGELHEAGTTVGMMAIIIEGAHFDAAKLMTPV